MVSKKELIQAVRTSNNDGSGIAILSKTDEDAALDVLTDGMLFTSIVI